MNSSIGSSTSTVAMLIAEFLATEKDATRVWLRAEMDRLVDPMLDSIFNRLKTKLTNGLERTQSGDGDYHENEMIQGDQLEPSHDQVDHGAILNFQPSTSSHLIPPHQNVHYSYQQSNDPIHSNDNSNQQTEWSSLVQPTSNPHAQVNSSALSNDEQSNQNFNAEDHHDEGVCECDECVNGIDNSIVIDDEDIEDDDDDSDSVQWIEDEQELPPPSKKPRIDSTQPNNVQPEVSEHVPREATDQPQPNQVINEDQSTNKQNITVHLQSSESEFPETFAETELNDHLMDDEHLIGPFRCLVKDCKQSFDKAVNLGKHLKQSHQHTTQWHCDKCQKHFTTYTQLFNHNNQYHLECHFECSFPSCTFTGDSATKVYSHYTQQHKQTLNCQHSGCYFQTLNAADLKAHERSHIRPYRCNWPQCDYSSARRSYTLNHIRGKHLEPNLVQIDPNNYLELVNDLL